MLADLAVAEAQIEVELLAGVAQHVGEPLVDVAPIPEVAPVEGDTETAQRHVGAGTAAAAEQRRPDVVEERAAAALLLRGLKVGGGPVSGPRAHSLLERDGVDVAEDMAPPAGERSRTAGLFVGEEGEDVAQQEVR